MPAIPEPHWRNSGRVYLAGVLLGAACVTGCASAPEMPAGTGAAETAASFFAGLQTSDWNLAYSLVSPGKQKPVSLEQFTRQARAYRSHIGFDIEEVRMRSCEEHAEEALAHILLVGHAHGNRKQYREGLILRRVDGKWAVMLPSHFAGSPRA